jgi:hypothetical protein
MNIVWHQYRQTSKKHETELQNRKVIVMSVDFALNEVIIKEYVHIFWSWLRQKRYIWTRDCVLFEAHRQRQYSYVIRFLNAAIEFCAVVTEEKKRKKQDSGWSSWSELNWITMQFDSDLEEMIYSLHLNIKFWVQIVLIWQQHHRKVRTNNHKNVLWDSKAEDKDHKAVSSEETESFYIKTYALTNDELHKLWSLRCNTMN